MSCEYCKNKVKNAYIVYSDRNDSGVDARVVRSDTAMLTVGGWFDGIVGIAPETALINFCPMCGCDLRGDAQ